MFVIDDILYFIIVCIYGGGEIVNLKVNGMIFFDLEWFGLYV